MYDRHIQKYNAEVGGWSAGLDFPGFDAQTDSAGTCMVSPDKFSAVILSWKLRKFAAIASVSNLADYPRHSMDFPSTLGQAYRTPKANSCCGLSELLLRLAQCFEAF